MCSQIEVWEQGTSPYSLKKHIQKTHSEISLPISVPISAIGFPMKRTLPIYPTRMELRSTGWSTDHETNDAVAQVTDYPTDYATDHPRKGLAPLEFVLSVPILMFTASLMVLLGTAAGWKMRVHTNAREVVWRDLHYRAGGDHDHPPNWPTQLDSTANGSLSVNGGNSTLMNQNYFQSHPVVRGPVVGSAGSGNAMSVDGRTLDYRKGTRQGVAKVTKDYPVMPKLPPGQMKLPRNHVLLDGTDLQYYRMGLGSTLSRRGTVVYREMDQNLTQTPPQGEHLVSQVIQIKTSPVAPPELNLPNIRGTPPYATIEGHHWRWWYHRYEGNSRQFSRRSEGDPEVPDLYRYIDRVRHSPNFQPRVPLGSERATMSALRGHQLTPGRKYDYFTIDRFPTEVVEPVRKRIEKVPESMKSWYNGMYQGVINFLEQEDPQRPNAQQIIDACQEQIDILDKYNP